MKKSSLLKHRALFSRSAFEGKCKIFPRISVLFLLALAALPQAYAQGLAVKGKVTGEADGLPIPGVSVLLKGTTTGTITNFDGDFNLSASQGDTLVFSYIGMKAQELLAKSELNVIMKADDQEMDEVVVVGYGVKRKSVVTAAISSVKGESLVKAAATGRVETALQGQTSGVTVLPTSGAPGAPVKMRIRGAGSNGNTDPLYIVDGLKVSQIDDINPDDIESMEVLKDGASCAIYGTEGANGVVLITTKLGKEGEPSVNYNYQYGIQQLSSNVDLMDADQYTEYMKLAGRPVSNTDGYNTDWVDEISSTAPMQKHSLSFSGAKDKLKYHLSGSYLTQDGAIGGDNANFERVTFRLNAKQDVKDWLSVGANVNYSHTKRNMLPEDDEYRSIVNSALLIDPFTPVLEGKRTQTIIDYEAAGKVLLKNPDGQYYGLNRVVSGETANPVAFLENTHNVDKQDRLTAMFFGTLTPIKGLTITSRGGTEMQFGMGHQWTEQYHFSSERSNQINNVTDNIYRAQRNLWENFASYNKSFNGHDLTGLVGMSYEDMFIPNYYLYSQMPYGFENYAYHDLTVSQEDARVGGGLYERTMISYFGRLSYSFMDKYMFEGTVRRDASSILPPDNREANFYSASAGWLISKEDFWTIEAIDHLKVRASWGQNGSISNVIPFSEKTSWSSEGVSFTDLNGVVHTGSRIVNPANPDLGWEVSQQTNVGVDLRALNSRLSLSLDYFNKETKDLIIPDTPARSSGFNGVPSVNGGDVVNKGFEVELGWKSTLDFGLKYSAKLNLTTLSNEVTSVKNDTKVSGGLVRGNYRTGFEEGKPIWFYKGYETAGIDQATGKVIYVDQNNDGVIDDSDITEIGSPHPDLMYGFTLDLEYKNFDFSLFLQSVSGNDVYMVWFRPDRKGSNHPTFFLDDAWTPQNTGGSMPKPDKTADSDDRYYYSDLMVRDGSYLRIKQIQLGYTLPKSLTSQIGLSKVRGYVSLDDYFTFTDYPGMDPEAGSSGNDRQGLDRGLYPLTKKIMFGLNVSF